MEKVIELAGKYNMYEILKTNGIQPSNQKGYKIKEIEEAFMLGLNVEKVKIFCAQVDDKQYI